MWDYERSNKKQEEKKYEKKGKNKEKKRRKMSGEKCKMTIWLRKSYGLLGVLGFKWHGRW